jgi:putative SOS response-associated peptidase YedK
MPVILTKPEEIETWMTAPAEDALKLQRPLSDGTHADCCDGIEKKTKALS